MKVFLLLFIVPFLIGLSKFLWDSHKSLRNIKLYLTLEMILDFFQIYTLLLYLVFSSAGTIKRIRWILQKQGLRHKQ